MCLNVLQLHIDVWFRFVTLYLCIVVNFGIGGLNVAIFS